MNKDLIKQRIEDKSAKCPLTGCWFWLGLLSPKGYGFMRVNGVQRRAHRVSYETYKGPIPEGLQLDHLCRQPSCVNPDHLEPVTSRENTLRGEGLAARNARKTHCDRGHQLTPENTTLGGYWPRERRCRKCRVISKAEERRRHAG